MMELQDKTAKSGIPVPAILRATPDIPLLAFKSPVSQQSLAEINANAAASFPSHRWHYPPFVHLAFFLECCSPKPYASGRALLDVAFCTPELVPERHIQHDLPRKWL
jgi:hypothetical protein